MFAAELQLEAAGGIEDTSFVTMKLTIDDKAQIIVEAYQVSAAQLLRSSVFVLVLYVIRAGSLPRR